jgi:hypothetical protein
MFEVVKNKLATFFVKEKAKGRLSKQAREEQLADFCIATVQGAMLTSFNHPVREAAEAE